MAKVKGRVENFDLDLTDTFIEDFIYGAEGVINAAMRYNFLATFDADKHQIIENCASNIAAIQCVSFNPAGFTTQAEAVLICDLLWAAIQRDLQLLSDPRTVEFLKGL